MLSFLRQLGKYLPTFLLAFIMACAVWISAVTQSDPNEESVYPTPIQVTFIGQDPGLVITNNVTEQISVTLIAPHSIWSQLNRDASLVKAAVDLSGQGEGTHTLKIQLNVGLKPVQIVGLTPSTVTVTLEKLASRTLPVTLVVNGSPAVGYELGIATSSQNYVTVSGPESLVKQVYKITTVIDATKADLDIHQTATLQAVDINNNTLSGVTIDPTQVSVDLPVKQLGGYQNVVVKAVVSGQVKNGYRVTSISVHPATVTVFSSDPTIVASLPGYIETVPIDLTNATEDIDQQVSLVLPTDVSIIGNQTVEVQVGIAAIEGSITLSNMPVTVINLQPGLAGIPSPAKVDVILSGPLFLLDQITSDNVHITVDLKGQGQGDYQVTPTVTIDIASIKVESILPDSIQVTVTVATPTPRPSPTVAHTVTVIILPTQTPKP